MKKYTTLALVMALCASLLVGCGCSGNVAVTTTPTAAPTTESTTEPTTEAPTTEAPTTEATTAPTTEPVPNPSSTPDTTQESGGMMDGMTGSEGNMDADRGTVPDDSTQGARGRRIR